MSPERMEWMKRAAACLVHYAAQRTPAPLSQRLEEEWLADLAERRSGLARLRLGFGCYWATHTIAREQRVAAVAAARAPLAQVSVAAFGDEHTAPFSRRTVTFLLVVSLHAAVLCGLAVGVSAKFVKLTTPQLQIHPIDKPPPRIDLPPVAKPELNPIIIDPKKPDDKLIFEQDPPPPGDGKQAPREVQGGTATLPPPPVTVNRVPGGPGVGFPNAHDFYPPGAIRRGEQGIATVNACVDSHGRLTSNPTILQSTGSTRLDEGALTLAIAGSGHYRPATENGTPVNSCYAFHIRFDLRN